MAFVARDLRDVHHELNQPQNSILPQPGQAPILRKLIMKVHNYHALASNQSKRRPTQDFDANIDFETFNLTHRGKFLNSLPATHEPCRAGYRPYLTERGDILGVEAP